MLKLTDWKQNLVLLLFAFLMHEVLTVPTIALIVLGLVLVSLGIKVSKKVRNALALGVFASYWFTYGKIIDPEVGLNFLTSILVIKILEKEAVRDRYMVFFGLLLLISAGSLFEKTLTYVLFFAASFILLVGDFYSYLGQKWRLKDMALATAWVLPLTFLMFFLVPRALNPIPFNQGKSLPGEIGYTPDVNISSIDSLTSNPGPVFQVMVNRELHQGDLYWRGNTLSYNDGWNWVQMPGDREEPEYRLGSASAGHEVEQKFRLYGSSDYFFALDAPRIIRYGKDHLALGSLKTLPQKKWRWVQRYEAISDPQARGQESELPKHYLQVPLPKSVKTEIQQKFPGSTLPEVEQSIRNYFLKEKFSYSLTPGISQDLRAFLDKKIGFCSHYASAVALIFRVKGIPARLVSGFMGGSYNRFADFYLISQNDAHVWVEVLNEGKWIRLDPTEWIAPDRVRLGGEAFVESVQESVFAKNGFKAPRLFQDLKMWFSQWDFQFYQWLEEMDYHTQEAWLLRLKFKRQWLFSIIPLMMVVFMGLYMWFLRSRRPSEELLPQHQLWSRFFKKLEQKGVKLSRTSLTQMEREIRNVQHPRREMIAEIWQNLVTASFSQEKISLNEIKKKIKKL